MRLEILNCSGEAGYSLRRSTLGICPGAPPGDLGLASTGVGAAGGMRGALDGLGASTSAPSGACMRLISPAVPGGSKCDALGGGTGRHGNACGPHCGRGLTGRAGDGEAYRACLHWKGPMAANPSGIHAWGETVAGTGPGHGDVIAA